MCVWSGRHKIKYNNSKVDFEEKKNLIWSKSKIWEWQIKNRNWRVRWNDVIEIITRLFCLERTADGSDILKSRLNSSKQLVVSSRSSPDAASQELKFNPDQARHATNLQKSRRKTIRFITGAMHSRNAWMMHTYTYCKRFCF